MDHERFIEQLPASYLDWGLPTVHPNQSRFESVLRRVQGMTSASVLQLLNLAVSCLAECECYLEVGSFQGATLIGALLDNPECVALAMDNFSEFDSDQRNQRTLSDNLTAFGLTKQVEFLRTDFEKGLFAMRSRSHKVGVYFYDGAHDYRSQLQGLHLAVPLLSERALIVVDDSNFVAVKQANWDFMAARPECRLLFDLATPGNCHLSFWNGVQVFAWEANAGGNYAWDDFQAVRNSELLESISHLQRFRLFRDGANLCVERRQE